MKTLYLDCGMGAAGDMLTAALLELLPDPDGFVDELNALGIPGVQYRREASVKCGITGTHMSVTVITHMPITTTMSIHMSMSIQMNMNTRLTSTAACTGSGT